jgi:hypothetical protein
MVPGAQMSSCASTCAQGFDWINPVVNLMAVILGAALTYFTTRAFERRKDRSERRAQAFELLLKLQDLINGALAINRQLKRGIAAAEAAGVDGPTWTKLEEIASIGDYEIRLSTAELSFLTYGTITTSSRRVRS